MSIVRPLGRLLLTRGISTAPCTAGIQELFETPLKEGETRTAGGASVVIRYRCNTLEPILNSGVTYRPGLEGF